MFLIGIMVLSMVPTVSMAAGTEKTEHAVTVKNTGGCAVTLLKDKAVTGEQVFMLVTPFAGFVNGRVWVEPNTTVTDEGNGVFSFVMPDADVAISAEATTPPSITGDFYLYPDEDSEISEGIDYSYADGVLTILSDKKINITNRDTSKATSDRIFIPKNVSANLVLQSVNICSGTYAIRIEDDSTADVHITLGEGSENIVQSYAGYATIEKVGGKNSGTLYIDGTGKLTVISNPNGEGAGIGSRDDTSGTTAASNIVINGGDIDITVKGYAACIGGGNKCAANNIIINGGNIVCNAERNDVAAIGAGYRGNADGIYINGGTLTITGTQYGIGVGCPNNGFSAENVRISPNASIRTSGWQQGLPTDSYGDRQYRYDLENPDGKQIIIDGRKLDVRNHGGGDTEAHIYLTAGSDIEPHTVIVGEEEPYLIYYENGDWETIDNPSILQSISFAKESYRINKDLPSTTLTVNNPNSGSTIRLMTSDANVVAPQSYEPGSGTKINIYGEGKAQITAVCSKEGYADTYAYCTVEVFYPHTLKLQNSPYGTIKAFVDDEEIASETEVNSGTSVRLSAGTDNNHSVVGFEVVGESGKSYPVQWNTFVMPTENVTVKVIESKVLRDINVVQPENGFIVANRFTAGAGDTVTVKGIGVNRYNLESIIVTDKSGNPIPVVDGNFIMPDSEVTVTGTFEQSKRQIIVNSASESLGSISADMEFAKPGTKVCITAKSKLWDSYLSSLQSNAGIKFTKESETNTSKVFSFIMPEDDVVITGSFAEAEKGTAQNPWYVGANGDIVEAYFEGETVYVQGKGKMMDQEGYADAPWFNYLYKNIVIGEGVTRVGNYDFYRYMDLGTTQLSLPSTLEEIGYYAFGNRRKYDTLVIPASVEKIEALSFEKSQFKKLVFLGNLGGNPLANIASDAFAESTANVVVPESWTTGGKFDQSLYQFGGNLEYTVKAPGKYSVSAGKAEHGRFVFSKSIASEGEEIEITPIGDKGYYFDKVFLDVDVPINEAAGKISFIMPACDVTVGGSFNQTGTFDKPWEIGAGENDCVNVYFSPADSTLYVWGKGRMRDFDLDNQPWAEIKDQIKHVNVAIDPITDDYIDSIGKNFGAGLFNLEDVQFVSALEIGEAAFKDCKKLKSITNIGTNKSFTVGKEAFMGCTRLDTLVEFEVTGDVGARAFKGCENLQKIVFPDGLTALGNEAFGDCIRLDEITYTGAMPTIANDAFKNDIANVNVSKKFLQSVYTDSGSDQVTWLNDIDRTYQYGAVKLVYRYSHDNASYHVITVEQSKGGRVTIEKNPQLYDYPVYIHVWADSYDDYENVSFKVNGVETSEEFYLDSSRRRSYHIHMPDEDAKITVTFNGKSVEDTTVLPNRNEYYNCPPWNIGSSKGVIGVTSTAGGKVVTPKEAIFGETVALEAYPNSGFVFAGLENTDIGFSKDTMTFIMPNSDLTLKPIFSNMITYYNIVCENDGNGSLTVDKTTATKNDVVNLTARPKPGYAFSHYEVSKDGILSGNKLTMPAENVTVKAIFEQSHKATVLSGENGVADANVNMAFEGDTVILSAQPLSGYVLKEWQVTEGDVEINGNSFVMKDADVTVKAVFEKESYEIIEGQDTEWSEESNSGLVVKSNADISVFEKVLIDDEEVPSEYYDVWEGSTYVYVHEDFLRTLSVGEHTIGIISGGESAVTNFYIAENTDPQPIPVNPDAPSGGDPDVPSGGNSDVPSGDVPQGNIVSPVTGDNAGGVLAVFAVSAIMGLILVSKKRVK